MIGMKDFQKNNKKLSLN